ncbi:hypothetical protein [Mesomycoplasma lagogenitalium]|uniref:DNA-directed DNA polymerase n=1 Tax=Mesomycoplasma lagogenitalium TaxID=171286 RepID=A0ABY8LT97_9BACT|nr:hypothetical protein [Mesomycoplasma lagogenitalium]WGI36470.1 hypothetical protein QEG99_03325 [Mesomycoplasma lagogenitalium]
MSKLTLKQKLNNISLNIFIYDIEVFKFFWCVTFLNVKTNQLTTIKNDFKKLNDFVNSNLIGSFVGGYNNSRYDDYILKELLANNNPYNLNNCIINKSCEPWQWPSIKFAKFPGFSFDIINLLGPGRLTLKKYEGFLGLSIEESSVPFDYDKELSEKQKQEIINYNIYDVKATAYLFLKFIDQFIIRSQLILDYNLDVINLKKTSSEITAKIFKAKSELLPFYKSYTYTVPENIKKLYSNYIKDYYWIIEQLESKTFLTEFNENYQKEQVNININFNNLIIEFKSGGLHGAKHKIYNNQVNLVNKDIFSNYPNLIKLYNYGSRRAPRMSQMIGQFLEERQQAKAEKNKIKSDYLKELIVRPFGAMEYKYNDLWDAKQRMSICLTGQLIIFALAYLISPFCELLQINTDGILFKYDTQEQKNKIDKICLVWEKITLMKLEEETFSRLFQKDVNNYIIINDDTNKIKAKGAMVKYWDNQFHNADFNQVRGAFNNNLTAIDEAVVKYFLYNKPVEQTLKEIKEVIRFQFVLDIKGNYSDFFLGDEKQERRKVWRIFYVKKGKPVYKAYLKENGEWKKDKVANSSSNCQIYNQDVRNIKTSDNLIDLDYDYYEKLAYERIDHYLNNDIKTKINKVSYPGEFTNCFLCSKSLLNELVVRHYNQQEICKQCYLNKED